MDYVDYQVRTFLTQSTPCDDWDKINESLLNKYERGNLKVVWGGNGEPYFLEKSEEQQPIYVTA
jgi:hypothetical protein